MKYLHNYSIILDDMDMKHYRIRPISALKYAQDSFARLTSTKRLGAYDLHAIGMCWVIGECNMEFEGSLPFWSEEITVEIWISEITRLKIYSDFRILSKGKAFAKGNMCWIILNENSRRPEKTDCFAEKFSVHTELAIGEHKKFPHYDTDVKIASTSYTTNLSDIDFNGHVNNKSYVNIAEKTVPAEFSERHRLKSISIKFNKETFLGDMLTCTAYKCGMTDNYAHKITRNETDVCDILSSWEEYNDRGTILEADLKIRTEGWAEPHTDIL